MAARRILSIGGGGFMMEGRFAPIDHELLWLMGKDRPRVCVIPTPADDAQEVLDRFYRAFDPFCDVHQLTPSRKPTERSVPLSDITLSLSAFDGIFVTGENTKSELGAWREWGIDSALRAAYQAGVLLCGASAGAIFWYEAAFTGSCNDDYAVLPGLGLLPGGCCPHHEDGSPRAERLKLAVAQGEMPSTVAIPDNAAVLYEDGTPIACYSWASGASVRRLELREGRMTSESLGVPEIRLREVSS